MNISELRISVCAVAGAIGSTIVHLLGGWSNDITTLIIFMAIDFVMGLAVAGVFKKSDKSATGALDSRAGWKGLCKKCAALFFIIIAHRLDLLLGSDYIRTTVIIGFIVNETISIIENAGIMGLPLPKTITKAVEILKEKSDE